MTSPVWPQPGLKVSSADTISGVFTWLAIKTVLLQQIFTVPFVLRARRKKKNQHFRNSFPQRQISLNEASSPTTSFQAFRLPFLFPTHCRQQPLPRARWPLINGEDLSPAWSGKDAAANRMFVPLAAQGKGISGMIWVKKSNVSFGSLPWIVLELLFGGFIYTKEIQANKAALGYQDGLSFWHFSCKAKVWIFATRSFHSTASGKRLVLLSSCGQFVSSGLQLPIFQEGSVQSQVGASRSWAGRERPADGGTKKQELARHLLLAGVSRLGPSCPDASPVRWNFCDGLALLTLVDSTDFLSIVFRAVALF